MKKNLTALLAGILCSLLLPAQETSSNNHSEKQLNFFIISQPKKGKLDLATRFNIVRTGVRSLFRKKFISIVAEDAKEMSAKLRRSLEKHHATLGTIWFDSHGLYKSGHALFFIGKDVFSYDNINDSLQTIAFRELAPYCTSNTNVVIGSCYGGATFDRISFHSSDSVRMNGDSLMMGLENIFKGATIYGSESWVMTKPGLFKNCNAVAGFPTRKLFRDVVYRPAWQHVGIWNAYSKRNDFRQIPPVHLDRHGNLKVRKDPYLSKEKTRKRIARKMDQLKPGLLKA
jgi:hypothetical protein